MYHVYSIELLVHNSQKTASHSLSSALNTLLFFLYAFCEVYDLYIYVHEIVDFEL
jgi:uncharacterized PurR-regulated membrane protein YhhQ (DUF165 family)